MSRQWCGLGYKAFALRRQLDAWDLAPILKVQNRTALQVHATGNGIVLGEKLQLQNFRTSANQFFVLAWKRFWPCNMWQYVALIAILSIKTMNFDGKLRKMRKRRQRTTCNGALAQSLPKVCPNFSNCPAWLFVAVPPKPQEKRSLHQGDSRACSDSY